MDELRQNRLYEGVIEGYNSDGAGVARVNGAVVFVPDTVRGERVEFRVTRTRKASADGTLSKILTPSPYRRAPDCPYFGRCGGCAFRHVSYEEELWAKRQRVQDALTRLGGAEVEVEALTDTDRADAETRSDTGRADDETERANNETRSDTERADDETPSGGVRPERYRNKIQYPVGPDGTIGFYRAGSHELVDVRDCLLQPSASVRTADAVRAWMTRYRVPGYDERAGKGLVRHVYVRMNRRGESVCCIVANAKALPKEPELVGLILQAVPETRGVVLNVNTRRTNVVLGERFRTLWGQSFLVDTLRVPAPDGVRELSFQLSPASFYQVNPARTELLYARALEYAALDKSQTAFDLYCGIGTITLSLALWAGRTLGAELVTRAVLDAQANAARNGITNAEFFAADATQAARRLLDSGARPDVITVDPPRKGLTPDGIAAIAAMNPARVVYVSCDPGTLGRDVRLFADRGYTLRRASAVDLFPGANHVESVVLLSV